VLIPHINRKLRLLDALPWSSFIDTQRVGVLPGNPPPSLLKKYIKSWMKECVPLLHPHTTELRALHGALRDPSPPGSEDQLETEDEDDAFDYAFNDAVRQEQHRL
jgi:hypothetical protein